MKEMFKRICLPGFDTMLIILILWICTLPLIALIVVPIFGPQIGIGIALGLLLAMLLVCWVLCIPLMIRHYQKKKKSGAT